MEKQAKKKIEKQAKKKKRCLGTESEAKMTKKSKKNRNTELEETDNDRPVKCGKKIKKSELGESSDGGEKSEEESKRMKRKLSKKKKTGKVLIEIESSSKKKRLRLKKKDFILISKSKSGGSGKAKKVKRQAKSRCTKNGFGKLLTFKVDGIPSKLAHYAVNKFKARKMKIRTPSGHIKVDTNSIHSLLGVTKGGIKMYSITPLKVLDDKVKQW
ncbi:hypothetical protein L1987_18346 [Smallanthus sonchifolius]|uniref:Uncharacterized protein n=1 Tax=Smallanthus sonchifolius TaxID=185202 RepID=A0ACB9J1N0_9ASTR|nr:hypothetical protein L1987_18346 [Smallanthus sonchifolius]